MIGDPTLLGWLTVAAYLAAAMLSAACTWQADRIFPGKYLLVHRLLWGSLAAVLLFLGINKQLDLQSLLTQVGREVAARQGWYEMRQSVQNWLIAAMALASIVMLVGLGWILRQAWRFYWPMLFGLVFLARFIIVRAASFWGVSLPQLSQWTGGLRINWLLEISGAVLVCISAWITLKQRKNLTAHGSI